jgi:prepilin-type N-terminal cleavage/methylation domain-containing protein
LYQTELKLLVFSKSKFSSGFSLIEVTVATAIISIMVLIVVDSINRMNLETRKISEKLVLLELNNQLTKVLNSKSSCTWQLRESSPGVLRILDLSGSIDPVTGIISNASSVFSELRDGASPTSGGVIAQVGQAVQGTQIVVGNLVLEDIVSVDPSSRKYRGNLKIKLSASQNTLLRKPLQSSVYFQVDSSSPISSKTIVNCHPNETDEVLFDRPRELYAFNPGSLGNTPWTQFLNSPSSIGVPTSAQYFLLKVHCAQASIVFLTGTSPQITLCRSANNDTGTATMWISRYVDGLDLLNSFQVSGIPDGGNSTMEVHILGYR